MMRLIRSIPITPSESFEVKLSHGALILCAGIVGTTGDDTPPQIIFWCSVDPQEERDEIRTFEAYFNNADYETKGRKYIDSLRLDGRNFIHIFEKIMPGAPNISILDIDEKVAAKKGSKDGDKTSQAVGSDSPAGSLAVEEKQGMHQPPPETTS